MHNFYPPSTSLQIRTRSSGGRRRSGETEAFRFMLLDVSYPSKDFMGWGIRHLLLNSWYFTSARVEEIGVQLLQGTRIEFV